MNYETASYFEINKAVATDSGLKLFNTQSASVKFNINSVIVMCDVTGRWIEKDYCNSPSDAWPIIFEHKISIEFRYHKSLKPMAKRYGSDQHNITDENPLRAAMIVFLKMQE